MLCDTCHERKGIVFVVDVRDGRSTELHVCESCYERREAESRSQEVRPSGWTSYGPGDVRFDES